MQIYLNFRANLNLIRIALDNVQRTFQSNAVCEIIDWQSAEFNDFRRL